MLTQTHTHTHLTALCPGLPGWAGTRKVKPIWILLKQETVRGSGISWAIGKSAPRFRQITMPAPHHSVFLQAGCPSCHPTNCIKALKGHKLYVKCTGIVVYWQVALGYVKKYGVKFVRVLTLEKNRGKGGAVRMVCYRRLKICQS